jgi:uncharacterized protein (DUF433 family)
MAKTEHLSFRIADGTLKRLEERAELANEPKTSVVERYVEEGLRMDDHPGVHFVDGPMGRRPALVGTGLDVWEVIETVRANANSIREAAEYLEVPERLVQIAVRYYGEYRSEIDGWIERVHRQAEREEERWRLAQGALA